MKYITAAAFGISIAIVGFGVLDWQFWLLMATGVLWAATNALCD